MSKESSRKSEAAVVVAKDASYVLRPWNKPRGEPLPIVDASGCNVTDINGKQYLDFTSGYFVNNAGHRHPAVIAAATEQLNRVTQVSGKHTTLPAIGLAERLVALTPRSIDKVMYATGGSEANELALKMARQHTGKPDIAYIENGYHGLTLGSLATCANEGYRQTAGIPLGDHTYSIPTPYCYRCPHAGDCATQCLDEAEAAFDARPDTAALIAEPIQAVGGIIPPERWWKRIDEMRRARGMLLILDEVQTGLGRTGAMFAAEHYGLEPDIMTGGKGLSGGVGSLAVAMAGDAVAANFAGGTTPTSGGNAVSAAAGLALIGAIVDDGLIENSAAMGEYLSSSVAALDDPWVGDIRFRGLLGGVELVVDRATKQIPGKPVVVGVREALHEEGMLITTSGPHGNVLRLQPPLCITSAEIDTFVAALQRSLKRVRQQT
jgi:4-aminobutyrate aminotransferase-like enzyme